jgi:hypothetical protein
MPTVFLLLVSYAPFFGGYIPGALYFVALATVILVMLALRGRRRAPTASPGGGPLSSPGAAL